MGPSVFSQFFLHPAFVTVGSVLLIVATPIIIHFINRLRFRKVRFAAMEFLLQSDKQNRQRVLLEQLLLLLLRILIVLALLALIARMIFDQKQLAIFGGSKAHHTVLLDDSASMRQQWGETSAFQEGIKSIKALVAEGAKRPDSQKFTLVLLSNPAKPLFSAEDVNDNLVKNLEAKLNNLRCSHRSLDMVAGLDTIRAILSAEGGVSKTLHVISDFRGDDWKNKSGIGDAFRAIDEAKIKINPIRSLPDKEGEAKNLAISGMSGETQAAAAGVPFKIRLEVTNHSQLVAKDVRITLFMDGQKLPMVRKIDVIQPGEAQEDKFYLTFKTPGKHTLEFSLAPDALDVDNRRFMTLDIQNRNAVLIIDGATEEREDGQYVADALAANPDVTGYTPLVEGPDYLRKHPLGQFQCIYMLNVSELRADSVEYLTEYVKNGGGLAWFMGNMVKPNYYNEKLYHPEGQGLFPVLLGNEKTDVEQSKEFKTGPDLKFGDHPMFEIFSGQDNPFVESVVIEAYLPVSDKWVRDDNIRKDGVATIARFRNNSPFMFEHQLGDGKIFTCLTSGGTLWNEWSSNPSYVVFLLELEKNIARNTQARFARTTGSSINLVLDPSLYTEKIEILTPGENTRRSHRLDAQYVKNEKPKPEKSEDNKTPDGKKTEPEDVATVGPRLALNFGSQNTDKPGVYVVRLAKTEGNEAYEEEWLAFNAPEAESHLVVAKDSEILARIGKDVDIKVQSFGSTDWIEGQDAGQEMKRYLLILLVILFLLEQALAYRLSFHSTGSARSKKPRLAGPARATS